MDYSTQSTVVLQFDECDKRMCTSVVIIDDSMIENEESLTVTLHETPETDDAITLTVVNGAFDNDCELIFLVCSYCFRWPYPTSQWLRWVLRLQSMKLVKMWGL